MSLIFEKGGWLDRYLEGYQERPGQIEMAQMLTEGLHNPDPEAPNVFVAEGPVGVGKSFAYLFSALVTPDGKYSGSKVTLSTSSITLQNQLEHKDLPFVRDVIKHNLGEEITFASLKGIANYVCLREYAINRYDIGHIAGSDRLIEYVEEQKALQTEGVVGVGERPDEVNPELWNAVSVDAHSCAGRDCELYKQCFYQIQKRRVRDADVRVVNHALLAADWFLKSRGAGGVLPDDAGFTIIDECHELEDQVANFATLRISERSINRLAGDLEKMIAKIIEGHIESVRYQEEFNAWRDALSAANLPLLIELVHEIARENPRGLVRKTYPAVTSYAEDLYKLAARIGEFYMTQNDDDLFGEEPRVYPLSSSQYASRLQEFATRLEWLATNPAEVAIFAEKADTDRPVVIMTPVNIDEFLAPFWQDASRRFVLTSATCSVNDEFDFLYDRLGIPEKRVVSGMFDSPFDYEKQAALIIPRNFDPKMSRVTDESLGVSPYDMQVLYGIDQIVNQGYKAGIYRTLILFTSYRQMSDLVPLIAFQYDGPGKPFKVFDQKPATNKGYLLKCFEEEEKSILVAQAASFGTGVDVKGNKNVIIVKLNFDVPDEPLFKARSEMIEKKGGNPFAHLSVPQAIIRTKQQIGRSVRTESDRAVIAIFDGRLTRPGWGRRVLNSLPTMKMWVMDDWTPKVAEAYFRRLKEEYRNIPNVSYDFR